MPDVTKRASFYASTRNRRVKTFHIETDGCIVNITVGLTDNAGRRVTRVDVIPDDERRGGDGQGNIWRQGDNDARVICISDAEPPDERPSDTDDLGRYASGGVYARELDQR